MAEERCTVGDVELCYEQFGRDEDPVALLVMGLGTQMLAWREEFCERLAARGLRVVRFDNRDNGRSTILRHIPPPTARQLITRELTPGYTLEDMADDAVGLLDHLGAGPAHVVGASMGGMIAQTVAIRHPDRVASLTSIMSTTGARNVGQPALRLYPILLRRAPREREAYIEFVSRMARAIGSPGFPHDDAEVRAVAARAHDRGIHPAGTGRQLAAIIAASDRTPALRGLDVPALVVHGLADRLVRPSGGRATAAAIPGARLEEIRGMGHDLPRGVWPRVVDGIAGLAERAAGARTDAI
jgi:pimeloyl-ACP methyl ester carboxylesterase